MIYIILSNFTFETTQHTSAASKLFYGKAKKNIWLQVNTIVFLGLILVVAAAVRHLTVIGRGTPLLLNTIQVHERTINIITIELETERCCVVPCDRFFDSTVCEL